MQSESREKREKMRLLHWWSLFALCAVAFEVRSGQTCYRDYTDGVLYRGTVSQARAIRWFGSYQACQNWTDQSPNSHNYTAANYPNTGLGDHNYCRNPDVNGTKTQPWCYYKNSKGSGTCWQVSKCADSTCYSGIGKGGSYSGGVTQATVNSKKYTCLSWSDAYSDYDFSAWSGLKTSILWIRWSEGNKCRNPGFVYEKPWCFYKTSSNSKDIKNATCDIPKCNDVGIVNQTCGGNGGDSACVFPFKYQGFTFINCTTYLKSASWCATERDSDHVMTKWGYCQCPRPTTSIPTTAGKTTQPTTTQPVTTQPKATQLVTTQLITTESATTRAVTQLKTTKPETTQPMTTQSASTQTATTSKTTTLSSTTQLATTKSVVTVAATTKPVPTTSEPPLTTQTVPTNGQTTGPTTPKQTSTQAVTRKLPTVRTDSATSLPATTDHATNQLPSTETAATSPTPQKASPVTTTTAATTRKVPSITSQVPHTSSNPFTTEKLALTTLLTSQSVKVPSTTKTTDQAGPTVAQAQSQSALPIYIGAAAGGAVVVVVIVIVLVIGCRRKTKTKKAHSVTSERGGIYMESLESTKTNSFDTSASNPVYLESEARSTPRPVDNYASAGPQDQTEEEFYEAIPVDKNHQALILLNRESRYAKDQGSYAVPPTLPPRKLPSTAKMTLPGQMDCNFYAPANSEEGLYGQFSEQRIRHLKRRELAIKEHLGSGEFGNVEKAIWRIGTIDKEVAVKTLISAENRVQFLKEAAVMGQFNHRNIVELQGLVTEGEPLMIVVEFMAKGDLKNHLVEINASADSSLPKGIEERFLLWAKDIAAGMKYLSEKGYVHRDLAARNVMLNKKLVAKIGDFGLSRNLDESNYYQVNSKTKIPARWTAPEAIHYKKYSSASDVWSFGIVMYEIWSVGKRPYGYAKNSEFLAILEKSDRLPPPPGCPRAIYAIMIDCWHPDHRMRPKFSHLCSRLGADVTKLLLNRPGEEQIKGKLGDPLEDAVGLYRDLKLTYVAM